MGAGQVLRTATLAVVVSAVLAFVLGVVAGSVIAGRPIPVTGWSAAMLTAMALGLTVGWAALLDVDLRRTGSRAGS